MKRFTVYFLIITLFYMHLEAGWNEDFDQQTDFLIAEISEFQHPDYLKEIAFFRSIRKELINDKQLVQQIRNASRSEKIRVQKNHLNIIIKKRDNNHIHEFYAWELSYLCGSNEYVLQAFPIEIGGIHVIVQHLEEFEVGNIEGGGYSAGHIDKISLSTYWKAHLQAYLLGFADLACANIGVNKQNMIRFFDNEASLIYYNVPFKTARGFSTGFLCQSYDWPQYTMALNNHTAKQIRRFVASLENSISKIIDYLTYRKVDLSLDLLKFRIDKVRSFKLKRGVTFKDFFVWVYPKMAPGLDALSQIVGEVMHKKVGHGTTLFFIGRLIKDYNLSTEQRAKIKDWIHHYID